MNYKTAITQGDLVKRYKSILWQSAVFLIVLTIAKYFFEVEIDTKQAMVIISAIFGNQVTKQINKEHQRNQESIDDIELSEEDISDDLIK